MNSATPFLRYFQSSWLRLATAAVFFVPAFKVQSAPKQVVELSMQLQGLCYQGPAYDDVTGYVYALVAGTQLDHQVELPLGDNTWPPSGPAVDLPPNTLRLEVDRAYPFVAEWRWTYQSPAIHFDLPCGAFNYTLTIRNGEGQIEQTLTSGSSDYGITGGDFPSGPEHREGTITLTVEKAIQIDTSSCSCDAARGESLTPYLRADGLSQAFTEILGLAGLTWSIDGDDLGCEIEEVSDGEDPPYVRAVITAGTEGGTITVRATDSTSGCTTTTPLDLVCPPGSSCSSGSCGDFSDGQIENDAGIRAIFALGGDAEGLAAGKLFLAAKDPIAYLLAPDKLRVLGQGPNTEAIWQPADWTDDNTLRQMRAPEGLVDVVVTSVNSNAYDLPDTYELRFYRDDGSGFTASNGLYDLSGETIYLQWEVEITGMSTNAASRSEVTFTGVIFTETKDSVTREFSFSYSPTQGWTLTYPDELGTIRTWEGTSGGVDYKYYEIQEDAATVAEGKRGYETINGKTVLTEVVEGSGTNERKTDYTYYDATAALSNRYRLKQVDYPDGRWVIYDYDDDGRIETEYHAWGDQAPTTTSSNCKVIAYTYAAGSGDWDTDDDADYMPHEPRLISTSILGHEVSRTYRALQEGRTVEKVAVNPGDLYTDTDNLVSTNWHYTSSGVLKDARVWKIRRPDGTMAFYDYSLDSNGNLTTTVESGDPNGAEDDIDNGTQTLTVNDALNQLVSRIRKPIVSGSASSIQLEGITNVYTSDNLSYTTTRLDGRTHTITNGCCGSTQEIDWSGSLTEFDYDDLGRLVDTIHLGITNRNVLDTAGRTVQRQRIGTDGTTNVLETLAYDSGGLLTSRINALGGTISYSETVDDDKLLRYSTNHVDAGQVLESYYRDGRLEERSGSASTPVRYEYGVVQDVTPWREFSMEIRLDAEGHTNEWVMTYYDAVGRPYKTLYADGATGYSAYKTKGQLAMQVDPDGVTNLFTYNAEGEREMTVLDMNRDGTVDTAGTDRITTVLHYVTNYVESSVTYPASCTDTFVHQTDSSTATNHVGRVISSTDGTRTWQTRYRDTETPVTTKTVTTYQGSGQYIQTTALPDDSFVVRLTDDGLLQSVTRYDSDTNIVSQVSYGYDEHGRLETSTDARNGTTTYSYNANDQIETIATPAPGDGSGPQVTTFDYDTMGHQTATVLPDGTSTANEYTTTGLLSLTYGSRIFPVGYTYDAQGRLETMITWRDYAGESGAATTTWGYSTNRGWLISKTYQSQTNSVSYDYTPGGRLMERIWERGVWMTNSFNNAGDIYTVTYSDGITPGITNLYARTGQLQTVIHNGITTSLDYNLAGQLTEESHSGDILDGLSVTRSYDAYLRLSGVTGYDGIDTLQAATYGYDTAGRLQTVTADSDTVGYTYHPSSDLVNTLTFEEGGSTTRLVTTRSWDWLNRLTSIHSQAYTNTTLGPMPFAYGYRYNKANQRTQMALADGSFWRYSYDDLGQVISGKRYWADGTPVAGQQFEYAFDDIGNRTSTGGRASAESTYTVNALNQYVDRSVTNRVDVFGVANPNATVSVDASSPDRHGEYFHEVVSGEDNTGDDQYESIEVTATYDSTTTTNTVHAFVSETPEDFDHDKDGNLTLDGRWTYVWDGENRLIEMRRDDASPAALRQKLVFQYDWQGRRIRKLVYSYSGGWNEQSDTVFLYDGWNLLAELNANSSNAKIRTYVWGTDLSGSMQGAGGVGGLLKVVNHGDSSQHFVAYDGNGNVMGLVQDSNGSVSARYEYGPFAEPLRASGAQSGNLFRFSTKYCDAESGLYYYGRRLYTPSTGRWLSRDPSGEAQPLNPRAENLYSSCGNDALAFWDYLGLWMSGEHEDLTASSFWSAWGVFYDANTKPCQSERLLSVISRANVATDMGADFGDLKKHYNRGLNEDIDSARSAAADYVCTGAFEYGQLLEGTPSKSNCENALKKLGTLAHTWQDYYSHMIGRNSPHWGDPGPIDGDPYVPSSDLKPSSWGSAYGKWGEHGLGEPAWREADGGVNRRQQAEIFVTAEFKTMLAAWFEKCRCNCASNWP